VVEFLSRVQWFHHDWTLLEGVNDIHFATNVIGTVVKVSFIKIGFTCESEADFKACVLTHLNLFVICVR
jgi:hypothetical protein